MLSYYLLHGPVSSDLDDITFALSGTSAHIILHQYVYLIVVYLPRRIVDSARMGVYVLTIASGTLLNT